MITAVLDGAGQRGARVYAAYARLHPDEIKVVAAAEPDEERRQWLIEEHGLPDEAVFTDWRELFEKGKLADCCMICTQDRFHVEPVKAAFELGYHVMCEKPMSPDPKECLEMGEYAGRYQKTLTICHVLRYSPFFTKIKEMLDSGAIGELVSIQHMECVAFWHQAHSFVRGNWRNSDESSPMILQKSCHDLDIFCWLVGRKCQAVSSFGSLQHFKEENAPKGSGMYCMRDCKVESDCPYSANKIYLRDEESRGFRKIVALDGTIEAVREALKEGPYGRCVYRCDNNVVDHQVVNLLFEGGITVSFTMCAFTPDMTRLITLMGTRGQITGDMLKNTIEIRDFLTGDKTEYSIKTGKSGHSGSDEKFMQGFIRTVESNGAYSLSSAEASVDSHLMAFAAEESRLTGKTVNMEEYRLRFS
ncbi:MAG: Gfo/Idh/MocA family oxidoreductase [Lachnospiraceae bacterium]|nr:Gfo/Idh/MocA family oxidoreductase [Lachnospiraceae bacterium]